MFTNSFGADSDINKFLEENVQSVQGFYIDEQSTHARYVLLYTPKMVIPRPGVIRN